MYLNWQTISWNDSRRKFCATNGIKWHRKKWQDFMTNSKQQEMKLLKVQDFEGISEQRDFH